MDFTAPTLGGAVKAVLLPHLLCEYSIVVCAIRVQHDLLYDKEKNLAFEKMPPW